MSEIQKIQVYLFEDVPLHVIVINNKGAVLGQETLQWNGHSLEPSVDRAINSVASGGTS